jgi:hypothetical protein
MTNVKSFNVHNYKPSPALLYTRTHIYIYIYMYFLHIWYGDTLSIIADKISFNGKNT